VLPLSDVGFSFPAKSVSSFEMLILYLRLSFLSFKLIKNLVSPLFIVRSVSSNLYSDHYMLSFS